MRNSEGTEKNMEIPGPKNTKKPTMCQTMRKSCSKGVVASRMVTTTALAANRRSGTDPNITKWSGS